ncbi:MAG: SCO family protein [Anaerolineae bacterium]|nr:SCO family protein [Anaerolineae bacterium]
MKWGRLLQVFYIAGGLLVISILWFTTARPIVVLPRMRLSPGYGLQDASNSLVTSDQQRGLLTLYSFAYTRCGDDCRSMYAALQEIDAALADQPTRQPRLQFITITVDPARDTPEALAAFALPFDPKTVQWRWLTGPQERVNAVASGGFEVLVQPRQDGSLFFTPLLVLVDGAGVVRASFEGSQIDSQNILSQLALLYKEIERSQGANRLAYEAAHFFACYP